MSVDLRGQLGDGYTDESLAQMKDGMKDGGGVELPFAHLIIWASNGDARMAQLAKTSPTSYYGGWNIDSEKLKDMADSGSLPIGIEHTGWIKTEKSGRDQGKNYVVYEARSIHIAPICKRFSWLSKDGKSRVPEYDDNHRRSHLQVLCLVGVTAKVGPVAEIQYVAPAIISVKGKGQTEALKEALTKWCKNIDALRTDMNAKGLPYFSWWQTIGTSGEPEFVRMGKGSETGTVTPVHAIMAAEKLTADHLAKRFIGKDLFATSAKLLEESKEWVAAWKTANVDTKRSGSATQWAGNNTSEPTPQDSFANEDGGDIPF